MTPYIAFIVFCATFGSKGQTVYVRNSLFYNARMRRQQPKPLHREINIRPFVLKVQCELKKLFIWEKKEEHVLYRDRAAGADFS